MMKALLVTLLLLTPVMVFAAADECMVVEFSDHFEVVCEGDGKIVPEKPRSSAETRQTVSDQPPEMSDSALRQRSTNAPREASAPLAAVPPLSNQPPAAAAQKRNRQGRPNSDDLNTAIEARRKLIRENLPKE